jgi:hypothetical protein
MRSLLLACAVCLLAAPAAGQTASSTASGVSRALNPAISVNALFLGQVARDRDEAAYNGVDLQESEVRFTAIVDPFWKANLTFAVHPAHAHAEETEEEHADEEGYALDLEEATLDGRALPAGLALRLGKFYLPFGKHAPLHTHRFPFVEAPVAVSSFLGEHGLTEAGVQAGVTVPLPWYSDLSLYGVDGRSEPFDADDRDLVFGGRWTNLWDLSDATTLELGGSAFRGPDGAHPGAFRDLDVLGVDLTCKWISPRRSKGPALTVQGELILPRPEERAGDPRGWYALAQYRVHRNWWLGVTCGQADPDHADEDHGEEPDGHEHGAFAGKVSEYKLNATFAPSEFSALRAEVAYFDDEERDDLRFLVQWNFTIGSHPAHLY